MKVSCLPVSYFKAILSGEMSIGEWAKQGHQIGLDAIDLSILFIRKRSPSYLSDLRKQIEDTGVRIAMITTYPDFTHPSNAIRESELRKSLQDIKVAAKLGAELVRITAGQKHPSTGLQDGIAWAVDGLIQAKQVAEDQGITAVYENHAKPMVWTYPDFSFPTETFLQIVEHTEGASLWLNWDTANTLAFGDDPIPILKRVLERVYSVHVADTATRGTLAPVLIGTGLVPLKEMFRILKNSDFDGWLSIEEASFQGKAGIEAALHFTKTTWEEA
jgi:sugar phosphate isomerase/epimerase